MPRCPSDAPVVDVYELGGRVSDPEQTDSYDQSDGRFVVDVGNGRITSLTLTPLFASRFGFFRGSDEYSGELHLPADYGEENFLVIGLPDAAEPDGDGDLWLRNVASPYAADGRTTNETGAVFILRPAAVEVQATSSTGTAITTVNELRSALRAGTLASTAFTVVVDKRTQAVVALRQQR